MKNQEAGRGMSQELPFHLAEELSPIDKDADNSGYPSHCGEVRPVIIPGQKTQLREGEPIFPKITELVDGRTGFKLTSIRLRSMRLHTRLAFFVYLPQAEPRWMSLQRPGLCSQVRCSTVEWK